MGRTQRKKLQKVGVDFSFRYYFKQVIAYIDPEDTKTKKWPACNAGVWVERLH